MRRAIAVMVPVMILAGSCSRSLEGPDRPASQADLRGAPALVQAQIRGAAVRFVEAYRSTLLGGDDLEALAATDLMRRFAYWLGVTNRAFPGDITATSFVSAVGPATVIDADGGVLEVDVSAQIDVSALPEQGEPFEFSVPLDGPVRLASTSPGRWRVIDFVRFGAPVSGTFVPLDLDFERRGARITLDAFGGRPSWSFFVRIAALGPRVITLDETDVSLVGNDGAVVAEPIEVSVPLLEITPGARADGALSFEPLPQIDGVSLRIDLAGDDGPAPLEIPLRSVLPGG